MFKHTAPADIMSTPIEELNARNKAATKRIMIHTGIQIAVVVAIHVGVALLEKHLDKKKASEDEN